MSDELVELGVRDPGGDHISFTQMLMWLRCQRQWALRYLRGVRVPPPGAVVVGEAAHWALAHINTNLAAYGAVPPPAEAAEVYVSIFDDLAPTATWGEDDDPSGARDAGALAVATYAAEHAATIVPAGEDAVEEEVRALLPGSDIPVVGRVDVRTSDAVVDYKASRKRVSGAPTDVRLQLDVYAWAYSQNGIHIPRRTVCYLVVGRKPEVIIYDLPPLTDEERRGWLRTMARVREAMVQAQRTGLFMPALPGSWWCTQRWCGYWDSCQREGW